MQKELFLTRRRRLAISVGLFLWLVGHFGVTILYLMPLSGPGLKTHSHLAALMEPLFRQRWSLFAPDPPLKDSSFDYRCRVGTNDSGWRSKTKSLISQHATWRFTPAGRIRRLESAATSAALGVRDEFIDEFAERLESAPAGAQAEIRRVIARRAAARVEGQRLGYRLAAFYCNEEFGERPDEVAFRVVTTRIRPYSRRFDELWKPTPNGFQAAWRNPERLDELEDEAKKVLEMLTDQIESKQVSEKPDGE